MGSEDMNPENMGKKRTFSVGEAESLLPVLEGLLRLAVNARREAKEIEAEFDYVRNHVFAVGGAELDILKLARRRAQADKLLQQIRDTVAEIQATGVQVKDLDMGLLDFPCAVEGENVLLCWRLGEAKI